MSVGFIRWADLDAFSPALAREFLGGYLHVAVHQYDEWGGIFVLHDQCLHDRVFGQVELSCRNGGSPVLLVFVKVSGIGNAVLFEKSRRRSLRRVSIGFGHDVGV